MSDKNSTDKIVDYKVVTDSQSEGIERQVRVHIASGYRPVGTVSVAGVYDAEYQEIRWQYAQGMMLESRDQSHD